MSTWNDAVRLQVFVDEDVKHNGRPIFEWILERALAEGMSGGTVFRGVAGFGSHHHLHTARILRASEQLPLIVELIDSQEKIEAFAAEIETVLPHGFMTMTPMQIKRVAKS